MIYGYVSVSTQDQSVESQKNLISRYCIEHKLMVDEWIALEMSSRKSTVQRRIDELVGKLLLQDTVIVSELSRLGRSINETLHTIETILQEKQTRFILVKQHLDLNPNDKNNIANKVLITVFSMLAELERDIISERTKEGLRARMAYDKDRDKILHLYQLGVPVPKIIQTHLGFGNDILNWRHLKKTTFTLY